MALLVLQVHAIPMWWQLLGFLILVLGWQMKVLDLQPLQQIVNNAIVECLTLATITHKEAAAICGMSEANFYRALSGEENRNLSLARLFCLPYSFWLRFGPMLMWLVAKKHAEEIAVTFSLRRRA